MKNLFYLIIALVFFGCNTPDHAEKPLEIIKIFPGDSLYSVTGTNNQLMTVRNEHFIIKKYEDNSVIEHAIDSFVNVNGSDLSLKFHIYRMIFYKESENTTVLKVKDDPRIIDRYSNANDLVYMYTWENGKFEARNKLKDGEIVESNRRIINIKVKPVQ